MTALVRVSDVDILLDLTVIEVFIVVLFGLRDTRVRDFACADLLLRAIIIHTLAYHLI